MTPPQLVEAAFEASETPEYRARAKRTMPRISCLRPFPSSCFELGLAISLRFFCLEAVGACQRLLNCLLRVIPWYWYDEPIFGPYILSGTSAMRSKKSLQKV